MPSKSFFSTVFVFCFPSNDRGQLSMVNLFRSVPMIRRATVVLAVVTVVRILVVATEAGDSRCKRQWPDRSNCRGGVIFDVTTVVTTVVLCFFPPVIFRLSSLRAATKSLPRPTTLFCYNRTTARPQARHGGWMAAAVGGGSFRRLLAFCFCLLMNISKTQLPFPPRSFPTASGHQTRT